MGVRIWWSAERVMGTVSKVYHYLLLLLLLLLPLLTSSYRFSCPGPGFWRDPTSCTAFYRCVSPYLVYRYLCPPGTRYDARVHNCNHNFLAPPCNLEDIEDDGSGPQISFDRPSELSPSPFEDNVGYEGDKNYVVAADSIYPCPRPGYYSEEASCDNFYVCWEVRPGVLSAQRIFRCPDRYLFDPVTRLCQRAHKVSCTAPVNPLLLYSFRSALTTQLREDQLDQFFSQDLSFSQEVKEPLVSLPAMTQYSYHPLPHPYPSFSLPAITYNKYHFFGK